MVYTKVVPLNTFYKIIQMKYKIILDHLGWICMLSMYVVILIIYTIVVAF